MIVNAFRSFLTRMRGFQKPVARKQRYLRPEACLQVETLEDRALLSAGTPDPTFGNLGRATTDLTAFSDVSGDRAAAIAIQSDGKMVVAGSSVNIFNQGVVARYNVDGTLDPTFGAGGMVASSLFGGSGAIEDLELLPDGSILVAGGTSNAAGSTFGVLKLKPSGEVDTSFGIRGFAVANFPNHTVDTAHAIALQGANIVVAGQGLNAAADLDMLVAQFTADGNLDNSFGTTGLVVVAFDVAATKNDVAFDVTVDNSNKILLAGSADTGANKLDFALARLTTTGVLDSTFDTDGKKTVSVTATQDDVAFSVLVEPAPSNNIIVGGFTNVGGTNENFALARMDNSGALLGGFDTDGIVTTDFGSGADNSNDRIEAIKLVGTQVVAVGQAFQTSAVAPIRSFGMARYDIATGVLDPTFDPSSGGKLRTSFFAFAQSKATALTVDSSGRLVVAGVAGNGSFIDNFAIARYQANGALDNTFGNQGRSLTDFSFWNGAAHDAGNAVVNLPDGKFLVAGRSVPGPGATGGKFGVIAKYNADGTLDTTFAARGLVSSPLFSFDPSADDPTIGGGIEDMEVLPDGSILVTGAVIVGGVRQFGVLKLSADGQVDTNFGVRGLALADFADVGAFTLLNPHAMALQGTSIIVTGQGTNAAADTDMLVVRFTADGNRDGAFGTNGYVKVAFDIAASKNDLAYDVTIDNANKILIAGTADTGAANGFDFALARLTTTGVLDSTFDTDGKKTVSVTATQKDVAFSVLVEPSTNNILVGGYTTVAGGTTDFALARLDNLGALLGGFDTDGIVTTDFGSGADTSNDRIREIRLQGTKVVAAGFSHQTAALAPIKGFALARYDVNTGVIDSTLDATSGTGGRVRTTMFASTESRGNAFTLDNNGRYLVIGNTGTGITSDNFGLLRFQTDGTLDPAFGNGGRAATDFSPVNGPSDIAKSVAIAPDGKIYVAGGSLPNFPGFPISGAVARYNSDGTLDSTFGMGGIVGSSLFQFANGATFNIDGGGINAVKLLADGSILLAGSVNTGGARQFGVLKLTTTGAVDTTFGVRGVALANFPGYTLQTVTSLALDGTNIVVAGYGTNAAADTDMLVTRFTADGNIDNTFGATGLVAVAFDIAATKNDKAFDVTIDNAGKVVLAGSADVGANKLDMAVARLTTTGVLDTTFDTDGKKTISVTATQDDEAFTVLVEPSPSNNLLVGGYSKVTATNEDFALVRMDNSGALLGGFDTDGIVTTDFGSGTDISNDRIQEIKLQGTKVVVAGFAFQTAAIAPFKTIALARYDINTGVIDNTVDPSSGTGGKVRVGFFANTESRAEALAVDPSGNWVIAGRTGDGTSSDNFVVARLTDPPPPTVSLSVSPTSFNENGGTATVTATLSSKASAAVTVDLTFTGTGTNVTDYTRSAVQIVIPAGQLTGTVILTGVNDAATEGVETVIIDISNVTNATENGTQQVTANIVDDENGPPTDITLSANTVAENAANAVIGTLTAVDPDVGGSHTFTILPGLDGASFVIAGNQLSVGATPFNFEAGATKQVTIRVTDNAGATFEKTLTINVTNVNETPTNINLSGSTVAENAAGAVVGDLSAVDPDAADTATFTILPVGDGAQFTLAGNQLRVGSTGLDFETSPTRSVTIEATDAGGLKFQKLFSITVTDVNEAPALTNPTAAASFKKGGSPATVLPGVIASDPDTSTAFKIGGGTLEITLTLAPGKKSKPSDDSYEVGSLNSLGTVTDQTTGTTRTLTIALNSATTAANITSALQGITFTAGKKGVKVPSRQVTVRMTDAAGVQSNLITQTISVSKKKK